MPVMLNPPAVLTLAFVVIATPVMSRDVTVFAAASLKTALDQVAEEWTSASGDNVVISYGGSSLLARQIQQGAPADIFISASTEWMDAVAQAGIIDESSRIDLLGNTLVLIAADPRAQPVGLTGMSDALGEGKLAMAMVDSVPAGVYGKAALTSLGQWDALQPHVAQTDNVRAALALVATGEAPLGIVYVTDATAEPRVKVVATFPDDSHPPITYPAAILNDAVADPSVRAFFGALTALPARDAFQAEGFTMLAP